MRIRITVVVLSFVFTSPAMATSPDALVGQWIVKGSQTVDGRETPVDALIQFGADGTYRYVMTTPKGEGRSSGTWVVEQNKLRLSRTRMSVGKMIFVAPNAVIVHELVSATEQRVETRGGDGTASWKWILSRAEGSGGGALPAPPAPAAGLGDVIAGSWCDTAPPKQAGNSAADTWVFHGDGRFEYLAKAGGKGMGRWQMEGSRIVIGNGQEASSEMSRELVAYSTAGDMLMVRDRAGTKAMWFKGICAK